MNLLNIVNEIEKADPEVYERLDDRRGALKQFTSFAGKVAAVSLPFMIGSMFKKAYGQTSTPTVMDVLQYAYKLENLEAEFYKQVANSTAVPAADKPGFLSIRDHEVAHVNFLKGVITSMGGTAQTYTAANFDFTAHGSYPDVMTNYTTLLAVSQAFEDTGVRAYKGQAGNLISNKTVLQAALQIHSVEARHASHIRYLRQRAGAAVKPWVTGSGTTASGGVASTTSVYAGEDNTVQAGVQITGINGISISSNAASESFDEPLDMTAVVNIITPFLV